MRYLASAEKTIIIEHALPGQDSDVYSVARHERATVRHRHRWQVRAWRLSGPDGSADLDALTAELKDVLSQIDGKYLNDLAANPTTEWACTLVQQTLGATCVEITDEEGRIVRLTD